MANNYPCVTTICIFVLLSLKQLVPWELLILMVKVTLESNKILYAIYLKIYFIKISADSAVVDFVPQEDS